VKGGVLQIMPVTGVAFLMAMVAVAGMPPFSLFQSEFLIVKAALDSGHYLITALFVLFGAGIFAGLLLRIGGLVLGAAGETPPAALDPWRDGPILALAGVLVVLAFYLPKPFFDLIRGAASVVAGG
jgi:hydrogenase-4 component F